MLLVTLVLWLFLGQARAALIAAVNIPLALLAAFCGMIATGTPANLISLGAVDFGIIVDSTVIMVENIYRHLGGAGRGALRGARGGGAPRKGPPRPFPVLVIFGAFFPLFLPTGGARALSSPLVPTPPFSL